MVNYNNGKIYKIRSHQTDQVYIGSTTQTLARRIEKHRQNYKKYLDGIFSYITSYEILQYKDAYIELCEYYPCNTKEELNKREGEYIRNNECVNKQIAGRTQKEYRQDNKEKICEYKKKHYEENKDLILEKCKIYREKNKQKIAENMKIYRENNKEKIAENKKEKITCVCGSVVRKNDIRKHERTVKHQNFINHNKPPAQD